LRQGVENNPAIFFVSRSVVPAAVLGRRLKFRLLAIQSRLESLQKLRDREPLKRWQAHYDLILAQTVAYQVKCQISTSDHLNIIEDASLGYGPNDKVAAIVRQQIDRMVQSFAVIYSQVRNEP
jgi:predicted TIM-barrel fold metal-dependent hydrolase